MHILISLKYIYDTDNSADVMDWEKLGYACTDKIIKRDVWIYPKKTYISANVLSSSFWTYCVINQELLEFLG